MHIKNMLINIAEELNSIFNEFKEEYKKLNPKSRERKISAEYAMYFFFKYVSSNTTKDSITSTLNNDVKEKNKILSAINYTRKERTIDLSLYQNICSKIIDLVYKQTSDNKTEFRILSVDGSDNNTNLNRESGKLQTSLNMCYFRSDLGIPVDLHFKGSNKNCESKYLLEYLKEHKLHKDDIVVADRAYHVHELIKYCIEHKIKFVFRCKTNSNILKNVIPDNCQKRDLIQFIRENVRVVRSEKTIKKDVLVATKFKTHEKITISEKSTIILITNLTNEEIYPSSKILKIYNDRWKIEVYFKFIKKNFKFEDLRLHLRNDYHKLYLCQQIITYIIKLLENQYMQDKPRTKISINRKTKKSYTSSISVKRSLLVQNFFNVLMKDVVLGKLTENQINTFLKYDIKTDQNKNDRTNPRISLRPFTKWYVKKYTIVSDYTHIITAKVIGSSRDLNKNLKLKYKNIKITKKLCEKLKNILCI
jgi:hypothetical protein